MHESKWSLFEGLLESIEFPYDWVMIKGKFGKIENYGFGEGRYTAW